MPHSPQEFHEKMAVKDEEKHNKKLGAEGEKKAVKYLKSQKYRIVAKNFVTPYGEIDIIARKGDVLAFIEVKTRLTDIFGTPSEAVDRVRKLRYIMGANYFLLNKNVDLTVRFDIVEVFRGQINHIENAFTA